MKSFVLKRLALSVIAVVGSVSANAVDFTVGGVNYIITDKEGLVVEVTAGETKYSGTVTIPEKVPYNGKTYNVKAIGSYAFSQCSDLVKVVIGSNVEKIGFRAFQSCTSLKDINWSNNIRSYDSEAFYGCTSLTGVELSSSLESMGNNVFTGCINLTTAVINEGCAVIGENAFNGCGKLSTVNIPNSVTIMGGSAFYRCKALTSANIGNGVKTINSYTFYECTSLETVRIGSKVTDINFRAFCSCPALKSFTCYTIEPPTLNEEAFSSYTSAVYVPASAVDAYKAADVWKKFGTNILAMPSYTYLSIKQGLGGCVKVRLNVGESYNFNVQPSDGVKLKSLIFNGTDVTKQLIENTYVTPAITEDSELIVNFDSDSSLSQRGDMNGDNKLDATDVVLLVDEVMKVK